MAGRIAGLTIEIGGDTTKLQSALKGVDAQLRTMRTGLKDVDRLLKFNPTSTQLITQKQQMLKQSIEQTKQRLDTLKQAQEQMDAKGVDKNSEEYKRLQREIIATEGQLKNLEKEYAQVASVAGVQLQAIGGKMKELGGKIADTGRAVTTKLTAPIVAMAGVAVKSFQDVDKGMDTIVAKTGATGDALNAMKDSAKNLATEIPTDFGTAGAAVGEVNTRFDITGKALEDLSGQFVKFARLNGTDVSQSIDKTQKALAAYGKGADDASGYLDRLNQVGQQTGVSTDKLQDGIVQNATAFKEMGLSLDEATILMGQLEKSGVNSETVLNGMRKALKNAAKDGKPLNEALADMQNEIENGTGSVDGLTAAYDLFGKSGDQIYGAVKDGIINFKDLGISVGDAAGNIDKTFENTLDPVDKFKMAINQAKVAGADLGNALLTRLTPMIEKFQDWIGRLGEKFRSLSPAQQDMIVKIGLIAAAIGPVVMIVGKLVSGLGSLVMGFGRVLTSVTAVATGMAPLATTIGVVVGALAAVGVAAYAYAKANQKAIEEETRFTDEQQATFDALTESTKAYNEATAARDKAVESVVGEFEQVESLKDEYNSLIDSNGNIKKGYKERADYIKGELAEALGLEKSQIDELIDKNGKLKGKIDQVIQTQKAQAILEANKDAYVEALKNKKEAAEKLGPALVNLDSKQQQLKKAEQEYQALLADYSAQDSNTRATKAWSDQLATAKDKVDALKGEVGEAEKAVDGYTTTVSQSKSEIDRYEGLTKALADKDKKAVKQWVADYTQGLKSRKTATDKELKEQLATEQSALAAMRKARKEGDTRITDDIIKQQEKRVKYAQEQAGEVVSAAKKESKGVRDETQKTAKKIKDTYPLKLGKMITGSVTYPNMAAKIKEIAKGAAKALFPKITASLSTLRFAKAYDNPMLFTRPSMYGGAIFGDRGSTAGGEMVYGRDNLMRDIQSAVGGMGTTINVTVNGADNPEAWADRFVKEYQLQTRMA